MTFPPYPKYKSSGVEWLGDVPAHWAPIALRRISTRYAGGTPDRSNDSYWEDGTIPWINSGTVNQGLITEPSAFITEEAYHNSSARWVAKGALVMALAGQGKTKGMVAQTGIETTCNQSMAAISPTPPTNARYLYWLLFSQYEHIRNMAGGEQRDGLNLEILGSIPCLKILPTEQKSIAAFLDRETGRLDLLLAKKRELIERLKEKRTALISRTVTRGLPPAAAKAAGLNPNPKLKPSGLEWLGDIPEHWQVKRLKFTLKERLQYGANQSSEIDDPELPRYVRITDIDENGKLRPETFRSLPVEIAREYFLEDGDVLFARSGATSGKTFLYRREWGRCAYAGYLIRARLDQSKIEPQFLRHFTDSLHYWQWISSNLIQATIQNVSAEKYADLALPLPPLPEQTAIAAFLDAETAKLDALAAKVEQAIERLQEYRTALITAAVTGKIDVRKAKL
jgi:type I restriction enzyme S subunit